MNDAIHVLDRLLVLCTDGRDGYQRAAEAIQEPRSVHQVLARSVVVRDQMVSALTNKLVSIGYRPTHHGSIPGAIHRRWLEAVAALKPDATLAILHEDTCSALHAFRASSSSSVFWSKRSRCSPQPKRCR